MEDIKLDNPTLTSRTEEVQHIIDRMPSRFGYWITVILITIFILMAIFGWLIRYPDIVLGQIVINSNSAPLKLVSNNNGKLKLNFIKSMDQVKQGQIIGYIENTTTPENTMLVDSLIHLYIPSDDEIIQLLPKLPKKISLGEINSKYYSFYSALQQFSNSKYDNLFQKQGLSLTQIESEQKKAVETAKKRITMSKSTVVYSHKFYYRDSILFSKKVISESELDKSEMNYINAKDSYQNTLNNLINAHQQLQQTQFKIQELGVTKPEKEKELHMAVISAYNDLSDNLKSWDQRFVFRAPFPGKVQFSKFYNHDQFILNGELVFTVIPIQKNVVGQVTIPSKGSGKIRENQEVIVKLDNFPYNEYGSITGKVKSISLTSSTTRAQDSDVDTYQILVEFPNQLKTNYGTVLTAKAEAKGTAEIITNDRRLIERLFDNLSYIVKK